MYITIENGILKGTVPALQWEYLEWIYYGETNKGFFYGGEEGLTIESEQHVYAYSITVSYSGGYNSINYEDFEDCISFVPGGSGATTIDRQNGFAATRQPDKFVDYTCIYGEYLRPAYVKYKLNYLLWSSNVSYTSSGLSVWADSGYSCSKLEVTVSRYSPIDASGSEEINAVINLVKRQISVTLYRENNGIIRINDKYSSPSSNYVYDYIDSGDYFTIEAIPSDGWEFHHWKVPDGYVDYLHIDGNTDAELRLSADAIPDGCSLERFRYIAVFSRKKYQVNIRLNFSPPSWFGLRAVVTSIPNDGIIDDDSSSISVPYDIPFPVNGYFYYGTKIAIMGTSSIDYYEDRDKADLWCRNILTWDNGNEFYANAYYVPWGRPTCVFTVDGIINEKLSATDIEYSLSIVIDAGSGHGGYSVNGVTYRENHTFIGQIGDSITFTPIPDYGYYSSPSYPKTYQFQPCYTSGTEYVRFYALTKYNVTISTTPSGGGCVYDVETSGSCFESQTVQIPRGYVIHLLAKNNKCYRFQRWTGVPAALAEENDFDIVVNSNMNISAVFAACRADGRLIHCNGNILYDGETGLPIFQECDCSN